MAMNCSPSPVRVAKRAARRRLATGSQGGATGPRGGALGPRRSPGVPETGRCDFDEATSVCYTRDYAHERARSGVAQSAFVVFKHAAGYPR